MNSQHDSTGLSRSTANHSQTIQKERERGGGKGEREEQSRKAKRRTLQTPTKPI